MWSSNSTVGVGQGADTPGSPRREEPCTQDRVDDSKHKMVILSKQKGPETGSHVTPPLFIGKAAQNINGFLRISSHTLLARHSTVRFLGAPQQAWLSGCPPGSSSAA